MYTLKTGLAAATIAATFAIGSLSPTNAAPIFVPATVSAQSDVVQVRDGVRWYNGHRGYRHYRHGYRNYDGWWFPAGAFVTGALIGGAIANSNAYYGDGYYPRYYEPRYYDPEPRYYAPQRVYRQPDSYRTGYRQGYRDGYYQRYYRGKDITCTPRLEDAGKC